VTSNTTQNFSEELAARKNRENPQGNAFDLHEGGACV